MLHTVQRWVELLEGVTLSVDPPRTSGVIPMATALELFDWADFVGQLSALQMADDKLLEFSIDELKARAHVRYVLDDP